MSKAHKIGYRLLLSAEVLTKIEPIAPIGYALKFIGYSIFVIADANLSVKSLNIIAVMLIFVSTAIYSAPTNKGPKSSTVTIPATQGSKIVIQIDSGKEECG